MAGEDHVVVEAGRTPELRAQYERAKEGKFCPFCQPHFSEEHTAPILRETKHWIVTQCTPPREHLRVHLLVIAREHKERIGDMDQQAGAELFELIAWIEAKYHLVSAATFARLGKAAHNGAAIEHIHFHVMEGDVDDPNAEPVRQKVFDPKRIYRPEAA